MMLIRYKGIHHERFDAPFVGALISAIGCSRGCKGCFNQHLIKEPYESSEVSDIINRVLSDPFNEGIILGGLEWTEQYDELIALIEEALGAGLKVILFTGNTEDTVRELMPRLLQYPIWIKFGQYEKQVRGRVSEGVPLASDNQYIKYFGGEQ